jgi:hypothetical protein
MTQHPFDTLPQADELEIWLTQARRRLERERDVALASPDGAERWMSALSDEALRHLVDSFGVERAVAEADLESEVAEQADVSDFLMDLVLRQRMLVHFKGAEWVGPTVRGE